MPTKTFFNLPDEKRQKVIDAIQAEFARVPYEEVSINQIVKAAGIPRGSFYQYFLDKEDLLFFLLSEYRDKMLRVTKDSLERSCGDLFKALVDVFDFTYTFIAGNQFGEVFRNVFSDVSLNISLIHELYANKRSSNRSNRYISEFLPLVNADLLDLRRDGDLDNMIDIVLPITAEAFSKIFMPDSDYEKSREKYVEKLELLKRGFSKNKDNAA